MKNIKTILQILVLFLCIIASANLWAKDFPNLTVQELKAKLDSGEKLFLLNPLNDLEFNESHIPGSINIPLQELATTDKLPADRNTLIVSYCLGTQCIMYKKAAEQLAEMGFTNIMTCRDGIPGWVAAGYSLETGKALPAIDVPTINAAELKDKLNDFYLLDIREESLHAMGSIKGSHQIPFYNLTKRYSEIPKDKKIVVLDHIGKQVLTASRFLKSNGYNDVLRLQGGVMAWMNAGYPLEK
ncbi:MAG: rhodanese-like domain-containing protein [Desulfobacterales bacterium]|nr:rhodanese-like domain-containing protein [Desulfobacterales bacterium]